MSQPEDARRHEPSPGGSRAPGAPSSPEDDRGALGDRAKGVLTSVDRYHQRHAWLAVPIAVFKKFGDDRGGNWAALIAYYGFFSLFPLLLAFTTVLGFVVQGNERLQERIVDSALASFPIIGDQIQDNLGALEGSLVALTIGVVGSIWAGLGVILTLQTAMDDLWDVPRRARPNFLTGRLRAAGALAVFAVATVLSAGLASLGGAAGSLGPFVRVLALAGTLLVNVAVFGAAFRLLTVADVGWRQVAPGAIASALAWMLLLALGSWFVDRQLRGASELYGFFAVVIGLLAWISLGAQVMLLSAELNVVLARRLWPRALQPPPLTEADRRVLTAQVTEEQARPTQAVEVRFEPPDAPETERRTDNPGRPPERRSAE